ncbi:VOC family protein [Caldanaerobius polysaccharolyticus]|uniref:VOC family protein n=1 Tax=Caldanaerobius polysaccharolyticus TaxID=44256 RepID=UPI00047EB350|nr:VOC family protein [Caldanaerobius polysaccharolyticus]
MNNSVLGTKIVTQVGIIVRDIKKTAEKYAAFLGVDVPEIIVTGTYEETGTQYKGEPTAARAKLAFFKVGDTLDIELIEPDEEPSTWREFLDTKGEGVHHIAFVIKDMQGKVRRLAEMGMPLIQKGEYTGGRYSYIDCTQDLKVIVELLENDD